MNESVKKLRSDKFDFNVTGVSFQYLYICKRELWFYLKGIESNDDNVYMARGRNVDNNYHSEKEEVNLGDIVIDFHENGNIVEVKSSSKLKEGSLMQLSYYLWYLEEFYDLSCKGYLKIPEERKEETVVLNDDRREEVVNGISEIYEIYKMDSPPEFEEKDYCSSCAYHDLCFIQGDNI